MGRKIVDRFKVMEVSLVSFQQIRTLVLVGLLKFIKRMAISSYDITTRLNQWITIKQNLDLKRETREKELGEILALSKQHDLMDLGLEYVDSGNSVESDQLS